MSETVVVSAPVSAPDPVQPVAVVPAPAPDGIEILLPDEHTPLSTANKRTRQQREDDLALIAQMMAAKKNQTLITAALNTTRPYKLTRSQIAYDVRELEKRYKEKHIRPLQVAKARELEQIEHLEAEAYEGWERSKLPTQSQRVEVEEEKAADGTAKSHPVRKIQSSEKRDGDPAFLAILIKLSERRAKLLGLDAPVKQDIKMENLNGPSVTVNVLLDAAKRRFIERVQIGEVPMKTISETSIAV